MSRAAPERQAQVSILRWARLVLPAGSLVAAITNEHAPASHDPMARARFQMARKAAGVVSGLPDLICVLPAGRTVWIEVKVEGKGVLSVAQQAIHAQLRALGHHVGVATDIDTARGILLAAGVPLREAPNQSVAEAHYRKTRLPAAIPEDAVPF